MLLATAPSKSRQVGADGKSWNTSYWQLRLRKPREVSADGKILGNHKWEILSLGVESWLCNTGCGIRAVESWLWDPGCEILAVGSWLWNPGVGILAL